MKKSIVKKTLLVTAGVLAFATSAQAENAVNPAHPPVVKASFCTPQGNKFIQNGDGTYTFRNGANGATVQMKGNVGRAGGRPDGNPAMNFATDQAEYRVEWLSSERVKLEAWGKGKRAGQTQNNPAEETMTFTRCAA